MIRIIQIRAVRSLDPSKWIVKITSGSHEREAEVQDPLLRLADLDSDSVRWTLEDHPTKFPYDKTKCNTVTAALRQYGCDLEAQLGIFQIVSEANIKGQGIWNLEVCAASSDMAFQKWHWETLETVCHEGGISIAIRRQQQCHPAIGPSVPRPATTANIENISRNSLTVPSNSTKDGEIESRVKRRFNILFAVSRPSKRDDINPLIAVKEIYKVRRLVKDHLTAIQGPNVKLNFDIEISRPGTWTAFKNHVEQRTAAWKETGGQGGWFDLVHFDCHGIIRNGIAHLLFLSTSGTKALRVSGQEIGSFLKKHQIPRAVLHSCNSAKTEQHPSSNLAATLVTEGLQEVVAMTYKFTSSAAAKFAEAFYIRLLADPYFNVQLGLRYARHFLETHRERVGRLNIVVEIPDAIVPVLYVSRDASCVDDDKLGPMDSLKISKQALENRASSAIIGKKESDIIGREQDMLEIEWLLLRSPQDNIVYITGDIGVGKTTLVGLLVSTWIETGFTRSVQYWDLRKDDPIAIIRVLQAMRESLSETTKDGYNVSVIDHIDAATHTASAYRYPMKPKVQRHLRLAIRGLLGTNNLLILTSRCEDDWTGLPKKQHHRLQSLASYDAAALASETLTKIGKPGFMKNQEDSRYIENLLSRLEYNPLSLQLFLESMVGQRERLLARGLSEEQQNALGRHPDTPELLFDMTLREALGLNQDHRVSQELFYLIQRLVNLSEYPTMYMLYVLAIPASTYRKEWHTVACKSINRHTDGQVTLTYEDMDRFISTQLIGSGWMETFETIFSDGTRTIYYHIHPLLTNACRVLLISQPDCDVWLSILTQAYDRMFFSSTVRLACVTLSRKEFHEVQAECFGYLNAVDNTLSILELNDFHEEQQQLKHIQALSLLCGLWSAISQGRTPLLSVDAVIVRTERFLNHVEGRWAGGYLDNALAELEWVHNIYIIMTMSNLLSRHYRIKERQRSGAYANRCLRRVLEALARDIDWTEDLRCELAVTLLLRANSSVHYRDQSGLARQAFEMALRCYKRQDDQESSIMRSARIRADGYAGLVQALEGLRISHDYVDETVSLESYQTAAAKARLQLLGESDTDMVRDLSGIEPEANTLTDVPANERHGSGSRLQDRESMASNSDLWCSVGEADSLWAAGQDQQAKDLLMEGIGRAMLAGDTYAEHSLLFKLIDIAEAARDWEAAAYHIARTLELENKTQGGMWYDMAPPDRFVREARHGAIMLRGGMLQISLAFFNRAVKARTGCENPEIRVPSTPERFIDAVLDVGRLTLFYLTARGVQVLDEAEFLFLDGRLQALTIEFVCKTWPEFDPDGSRTAKLLERKWTPRVWGPDLVQDLESGQWKQMNMYLSDLVRNDPSDEENVVDIPRLGRTADQPPDISPLETGLPLYSSDPEGDFDGQLQHELLDLPYFFSTMNL